MRGIRWLRDQWAEVEWDIVRVCRWANGGEHTQLSAFFVRRRVKAWCVQIDSIIAGREGRELERSPSKGTVWDIGVASVLGLYLAGHPITGAVVANVLLMVYGIAVLLRGWE